jgi:ParB/RepB/Spo0J family partition protein
MKETITNLDKKKRIMLFRAPAQDTFKRRQLGKGLTLLGDGEILRLPFELHDAEADHRFADGCAPNQAELLSTPSWLRIVEDRPGPHVLATRDIKIKDILIGQRLRPVRPENVVKLAESLKQGQYRAITVRPHPKHHGKFDAIAGVTLIKAAESLDWTAIRADIIECNDRDAELWQALENLYRSELTALEQAEHFAVCVRRIADRDSGQAAKPGKSKGGRPESVITKTARDLPVPGKTQAARKKAIERGLRIAAISTEVNGNNGGWTR